MNLIDSRVGPYRLLRLLGRGGMGQVFAAVHERLNQEVALKLLLPEAAANPELVARFIQEGRALARLRSEGVVRILTCDRLPDGTVFLAMELLRGVSLRERMNREPGRLPLEEALAIGRRIAEVMVDIHAQGIVHRDLKPENIFLCTDEKDPVGYRLKLLDFGIAKVPPTEEPRPDTQVQTRGPASSLDTHPSMGTHQYMAPEQLWDPAQVDGKADVYSLGALLFELLSGVPPINLSNRYDLFLQHESGEPPSLRDAARGIPDTLSFFVATLLAKNPRERPGMRECQERLGHRWDTAESLLPGLMAFTRTHRDLLFGRRTEVNEVLGLLEASRVSPQRWVQIEGPSGVGKSSLVQAGVLPLLEEHPPHESPRWHLVHLSPVTIRDALHSLLEEQAPAGGKILLVLEQLEEFFALNETERHWLDERLSTALAAPDSPLRLLTTLRSDSIHRMEQLPLLMSRLNEAARYSLRPLDEETLTQVVREMARRAGLRLSEGLPERMVRDATSQGQQLPLLAHALLSLWSIHGSAALTHERYELMGGVGGALARQAQALLEDLGPEGTERAKWMVLSLVQVGRQMPTLRRARTWNEVLATGGGDALAHQVLSRLAGIRSVHENPKAHTLRLVVVSGGPGLAQQRVDLIHDTLLQQVPAISEWIAQERMRLERLTELEFAAQSWEQAGHPRGDLPTGSLLDYYRASTQASSSRTASLGSSERAARYLETARRDDRRRAVLRLAVGMSLIATTTWALWEMQRAEGSLQKLIEVTRTFAAGDWELGRRAGTLNQRRELLDRFGELLSALPSRDQETLQVLLTTIETAHRRSDLAFHNETLLAASGFMEQARSMIQRGRARFQEDADLMVNAGLNASKRGKLAFAREQWDEARRLFLEAIEYLERSHLPDDADGRRMMATSYSEYADLLVVEGSPVKALDWYDKSLALLERNMREPEPSTYDQALRAETRGARAQAAQDAGEPAAAETFFQLALEESSKLTRDNPGDTYYRWVLAQLLARYAQYKTARRAPSEALELYQRALDLGRYVHADEDSNKRYALVLARSLRGREALLNDLSRAGEGAALREERCVLVDHFVRADPQDPRFQALACR